MRRLDYIVDDVILAAVGESDALPRSEVHSYLAVLGLLSVLDAPPPERPFCTFSVILAIIFDYRSVWPIGTQVGLLDRKNTTARL